MTKEELYYNTLINIYAGEINKSNGTITPDSMRMPYLIASNAAKFLVENYQSISDEYSKVIQNEK